MNIDWDKIGDFVGKVGVGNCIALAVAWLVLRYGPKLIKGQIELTSTLRAAIPPIAESQLKMSASHEKMASAYDSMAESRARGIELDEKMCQSLDKSVVLGDKMRESLDLAHQKIDKIFCRAPTQPQLLPPSK